MTLKWCAFTGALMLAFVAATYVHKGVTADPPGVETRWWDGTTASKEVRYRNGQLASRVEFGDDGKTVITLREWNERGALTHSKLRSIKDGTVEEKLFTEDGKILVLHKLWNGDELTFRAERNFWPNNGKIRSETINTEDGLVPAEVRQFDRDGTLNMERKILDNADQVTRSFTDGKLRSVGNFKANGDLWQEDYDDEGRVTLRQKQIRLTGESITEGFRKGKLIFTQKSSNGRDSTATIYSGDKAKRKLFYRDYNLEKVEQYSLETGRLKRVLIAGQSNFKIVAREVRNFRDDGTLESVKLLDLKNGSVRKTFTYDATGQEKISEVDGGTPEKVDERLFIDPQSLLVDNEDGELP